MISANDIKNNQYSEEFIHNVAAVEDLFIET